MNANPYAISQTNSPKAVSDGQTTWTRLTRWTCSTIMLSLIVVPWIAILVFGSRADPVMLSGVVGTIFGLLLYLKTPDQRSFFWHRMQTDILGDAYAWTNRATWLANRGSIREAFGCVEKASQIDPDYPQPRLLWVTWRSDQRAESDDRDALEQEIIRECDWLIERDVSPTQVYAIRGLSHLQKENASQAIADCNEVILKDRQAWLARWVRAFALSQLGRSEESLDDTRNLTQHGHCDEDLMRLHAANLLQMERNEELLDLASERMELQPNEVFWVSMHGAAAAECVWLRESLHSYQRASSLKPGDAEIIVGTIRAHSELGNIEDAWQWLGKLKDAESAHGATFLEAYRLFWKAALEHHSQNYSLAFELNSQLLERIGAHDLDENPIWKAEQPKWRSGVLANRGYASHAMDDYALAVRDYESAYEIAGHSSFAAEAWAWLLATCPDVSYRDGEKAFKLVEPSLHEPQAAPTTRTCLAIAAAAMAEIGRFDEAVAFQQRFEQRFQEDKWQGRVSAFELTIPQDALKHYTRREPLRCRLIPYQAIDTP